MSIAEHMEHAAHAGHADHGGHGQVSKLGRNIGITMAMLGVLVALSSAMLGGARASSTAAMVEQNTAANRYQSSSTKYRLLISQLQQLHAFMPTDPGALAEADKEIEVIQSQIETGGATGALAQIRIQRLESNKILNTVTPNPVDVLRFVKLARDYSVEKKDGQDWADAYTALVHIHDHGAHRYEYSLLAAEFGIVICAIALLLSNKPAWMLAMALGTTSLGLVVQTTIGYFGRVSKEEAVIAKAGRTFEEHRSATGKVSGDEEMLAEVEATQTAAAAAVKLRTAPVPAPVVPAPVVPAPVAPAPVAPVNK
jgi:hypothetical protein